MLTHHVLLVDAEMRQLCLLSKQASAQYAASNFHSHHFLQAAWFPTTSLSPTHKIHNGKWDRIFSLSTETPGMNSSSVHSLNGYLEVVRNVLIKSQQTYQSRSHITGAFSQKRTCRFSTMDVFTSRVKIMVSPNWCLCFVWERLYHCADQWNGD